MASSSPEPNCRCFYATPSTTPFRFSTQPKFMSKPQSPRCCREILNARTKVPKLGLLWLFAIWFSRTVQCEPFACPPSLFFRQIVPLHAAFFPTNRVFEIAVLCENSSTRVPDFPLIWRELQCLINVLCCVGTVTNTRLSTRC